MSIEQYGPAIGKGAIPTERKNARRYTQTQAQIIASCDFKPLELAEGPSVSNTSTNGYLFELRKTLMALAHESIAENIRNYRAAGGASGDIAGIGAINVYEQQLAELKRWFGNELGGTESLLGQMGTDFDELNTILQAMVDATDLMNFAHADDQNSDMLEELFVTENDVILVDTPSHDGYYVNPKIETSYPAGWETFLRDTLKFPNGSAEAFSSTKVFLQLLQGVGYAARRFFPNMGPENMHPGYDEDEGSPYCIRPSPILPYDILTKLSCPQAPDEVAIPTLFSARAIAAEDWIRTNMGEIDPDGGLFVSGPFLENVNKLDELVMLLSRELSNSAALAHYETDGDEVDLRNRLQDSGGLNITTYRDETTYRRNATNLINNASNGSPFDHTAWRPVTIVSGGENKVAQSDKPPAPDNFAYVKVQETEFPGGVTGDQKCSLFEPNMLLIDGDDEIMGTRDFLIGALFDRDEVSKVRAENATFGTRPDLSRITSTEKEFGTTMEIYRDYIKNMVAIDDTYPDWPSPLGSTTPWSILHDLLCRPSFQSFMGTLNQGINFTVQQVIVTDGEDPGGGAGGHGGDDDDGGGGPSWSPTLPEILGPGFFELWDGVDIADAERLTYAEYVHQRTIDEGEL